MDLPVALGEIVAKKYRVDRVIGAGGMGVVVAAFHLELEQPVAIKFLHPGTSTCADAGARFRREARAAARIHSEHVARVLDIALLDDRIPYMVMELLDGHDLEKELELTGPLPVGVASGYILEAIDAVAEAHAAGIVHRDLKPTNVFLARRPDGQRLIKVLDFGISKLSGPGWGPEAALTRSALIFGSPLYMSPEQMRSARDVDARTDIWSLGAMLYELVAGRPPYVADSIPALCMAILNAPPPLLREVLPSAPPALEAILARCLARDVNERFETVAELAQALVALAPHGAAHAERARRILDQRTARLGTATTGILSSLPPPAVEEGGSTPPAEATRALPVTRGRTQTSWGETGRRAMVTRRTGTILVAVLALAGALLLISRLLRSPEPPEPLQTTLQAAMPRELAAADRSAAPTNAASANAPTPTPSADAAPPITDSAIAAAASAAPARPRNLAPPRVAPPPRASRLPANKGGGLTDFGGRLY